MDVKALFTNINHEDGMAAMKEKLDETTEQKVDTDFIMKLMEIILYHNIFEFHEEFYKQNIGAAMGSKPIPPYANILKAKIDKAIKNLEGAKAIFFLKLFLMIIFHYTEAQQKVYMHFLQELMKFTLLSNLQ